MTPDWQSVPLGAFARRVTTKNVEGNLNVLTISAQRGLVSQRDYFNKSIASENLAHYYLLQHGEFAYNKSYSDGYPIGAIKRLTAYERGVVSPLYICFKIEDPTRVEPEYLVHYFESGLFDAEVRAIAKEGARNHGLLNVKPSDFFALPIPLPPTSEQRKIAAILSAVDDAIEGTQAVIDQLQVVRKAMMPELLTRGLPGRHTRFKQTAIGEVPTDWNVVRLESVLTDGPTNGLYKPAHLIGRGALIAGMTAIDGHTLRWGDCRRAVVDSAEAERFSLRNGDLLVTRVYARIDGIGRFIVVPDPPECAVYESNMMRLRIDPTLALPEFVASHMCLDDLRKVIEQVATLGAQASINNTGVRGLPLRLPQLTEQRQIMEILDSLECRVDTERDFLQHLKVLKAALMSVLLTGELRVTPDEATP